MTEYEQWVSDLIELAEIKMGILLTVFDMVHFEHYFDSGLTPIQTLEEHYIK